MLPLLLAQILLLTHFHALIPAFLNVLFTQQWEWSLKTIHEANYLPVQNFQWVSIWLKLQYHTCVAHGLSMILAIAHDFQSYPLHCASSTPATPVSLLFLNTPKLSLLGNILSLPPGQPHFIPVFSQVSAQCHPLEIPLNQPPHQKQPSTSLESVTDHLNNFFPWSLILPGSYLWIIFVVYILPGGGGCPFCFPTPKIRLIHEKVLNVFLELCTVITYNKENW